MFQVFLFVHLKVVTYLRLFVYFVLINDQVSSHVCLYCVFNVMFHVDKQQFFQLCLYISCFLMSCFVLINTLVSHCVCVFMHLYSLVLVSCLVITFSSRLCLSYVSYHHVSGCLCLLSADKPWFVCLLCADKPWCVIMCLFHALNLMWPVDCECSFTIPAYKRFETHCALPGCFTNGFELLQ